MAKAAASTLRSQRFVWVVLAAVVVIAAAVRFYDTFHAPNGFYRDEAAIAAHGICLAQSGRALDGVRWPLETVVLGGGHASIVWLAPAVVWGKVFGTSIGAERALAAFAGTLAIIGTFFFGWFAAGARRIGAYAALAMAVSPWAFQFSRVAWDAAMVPAYLSGALALLFLSLSPDESRPPWLRWAATVASALLFAATCICYPPLRVEVPLVLIAALVWKRDRVRAQVGHAAAFVAVFLLASAKLWLLTLNGSIQGRAEALSVFNAGYWLDEGVTSRAGIYAHGVGLFFKNFFAHLSPSYLFISGDANPRHSTQAFGEWSILDSVALAFAAVVASMQRRRPSAWVLFAAFGYVAGILPAALTWEGSPHALRSIGALPFLAVLVGTAIDAIARWLPRTQRFVPWVSTTLAAAFAVLLFAVFFGNYAEGAGDGFDVKVVDQLRDPSFIQQLVAADRAGKLRTDDKESYPLLAIRYYELSTGDVRCSPTGDVIVFPPRP